MTILEKASLMQQRAWNVIEETKVIEIWQSIGATINLVGSLKTGLILNHRDIDFHIYTDPFKLSESFSAIAQLAENPRIKTINYGNLIDAEDRCLEWHAFYEDKDGDSWQIDMIHILNDSSYVGYFEKVAQRISNVLTDETREAILTVKDSLSPDEKVMGIQIYQAVIEGGVRDINAFRQWKEENPEEGIIEWMP